VIDVRFIYLGALLNIVGSLHYVVGTLRGRTSPNRITWILWAVVPLIAFFAQVTDGVGIRALTTLMVGVGPALVVVASFLNRHSYWKLTAFDWGCGLLSCTAIVLWSATGVATLAIVLSILADAFAALPTITKALRRPDTENAATFGLGCISALITLATIDRWSFSFYGFPTYMTALTFTMFMLSSTLLRKSPRAPAQRSSHL